MARVAIVGCGAMGSVYAGLMADSGHEVFCISLWEDHVKAINEAGLRVQGVSGDRTVKVKASTSTNNIGACDLIIIATKAFDVETAAESAKALIGKHTVIQTIQNGIGSSARVANIIGGDNLAIGVVGGFGASITSPGHAHHNGMEMIRFASHSSLPKNSLEASANIWKTSGFKVSLFDDADQMVWEKLIMNVAFSGIACTTELTIGEIIADTNAWEVARKCSEEAISVAGALGIKLDVGDPIGHVKKLGYKIPNAKPSMLLDYLDKRRSEIDYINGGVIKVAKEAGISTPTNNTVVNIIKARESVYLVT